MLSEAVVSLGVAGIMILGLVSGYLLAVRQAEWSAYSLAANGLALEQLEQVKAAKWDPMGSPPVDQVVSSNFPTEVLALDVPVCQSNIVYATNFTTISTLATNPPLKMVRVDCVWFYYQRKLFTNTLVTYRAPDQ